MNKTVAETENGSLQQTTAKQAAYILNAERMRQYNLDQAAEYEQVIAWLQQHGHKLDTFETRQVGNYIEIETPTREVLMTVLKAFPGKWNKSANGKEDGTIRYERREDHGVVLQCESAPPPPSCRIVEKWVEVPPQPATRKLVKVVECASEADELLMMVGGGTNDYSKAVA